MFTKIYEKIKQFIKDNYLSLLFYIVFITVMVYPLPYYIYTGGGTIDVEDKISILDANHVSGSFHMCYVEEIHATIPTYLLAHVLSDWDIVAKEEVTLAEKEDLEDIYIRDKIYLQEANQNAILVAYQKAKKELEIIDTHSYVVYLDENSNTNLKIGDEILSVDGVEIKSLEDILNLLKEYEIGDKVIFQVKNQNKVLEKYAIVVEKEGKKMFGIAMNTILDYETQPDIQFSFSSKESGPSGGLMITLAIYNKLIPEDITKGFKIAGTGTIDADGNVGSIGGVRYKLKGAVADKADVFLVPNGENYEECIELQKKYNYNIKIIGVSSFDEAITKLLRL